MSKQVVLANDLPVISFDDTGAFTLMNGVVYNYSVNAIKFPWLCKSPGPESKMAFTCPFDGKPMVYDTQNSRYGCSQLAHMRMFSIDAGVATKLSTYFDPEKVPEGILVQDKQQVVHLMAKEYPATEDMSERGAIPSCKSCKGCRLTLGMNPAWKSTFGCLAFRCGLTKGVHVKPDGTLCTEMNVQLRSLFDAGKKEPSNDSYGEYKNKWGLALKPFNMPSYFAATTVDDKKKDGIPNPVPLTGMDVEECP